MEFDQQGNLLRHWGGKDGDGYQWPASNHGLQIDGKGNIWIGGNGGANDGHILKFTQDGKFLLQVGIKKQGLGPDSNAHGPFLHGGEGLARQQERTRRIVADGYGNKRVAVVDMDTGKIKRYWGAYGNKPDDAAAAAAPRYTPGSTPSQQFRGPVHCADPSSDGLIYVCDRTSDRLQVFTRDGKFVKEVFVEPDSLGDGSTWDTAFSKDRAAEISLRRRRPQSEAAHLRPRVDDRAHQLSARAATTPASSTRCTASRWTRRATSTRRRPTRAGACSDLSTKRLAPVTKKMQGTVWPTTRDSVTNPIT